MNITALHIAHLLPGCRAIAIAGLGVFERLLIPASYDAVNHLITPPSIRIVFEHDAQVASSDCLIDSIVRRESMTADEARRRIETDAAEIENTLLRQGRYEFSNVCTLRLASSGTIACTASDNFVDSLACGWLEPLMLRPLDAPVREAAAAGATAAAAAEVETSVVHRREIFSRSVRIAASTAAAIAVFAIVALVSGFVNRLSDSNADSPSMASVNPAARHVLDASVAGTAVEAPLVLVVNTPADGVDEARVRPVRSEESAARESRPETAEQTDGPYCLVVASFASRAEAETFINAYSNRISGLNVLESQGRIRVYARTGSDAAALTSEARQQGIYELFPSAWVCRR
ncbi:MAG: hypothetical protein K2L16_06015 [Muribaculaceae bacterium]|nr:hypothetical protein [Muribaculaceae bacterium]